MERMIWLRTEGLVTQQKPDNQKGTLKRLLLPSLGLAVETERLGIMSAIQITSL